MNRRALLKMLAAAPAAFYLPALAATPSPFSVYGPPVMPTLLLGVAARNGLLRKKKPFEVKVWRNVDVLRAGLANRSMALSIVPSYVAANLAARGQKVKLVNIMSFGLLHIVGRGGPLDGVAALSGKTLVMPFKNDMPDLVLQALCRRLKTDFSKIRIHYAATPPEALALFLQKRADYALLPEPAVSMALARGRLTGQGVVRALDIQKVWEQTMNVAAGIPQAGLLVSQDFYDADTETVRLLQNDLQQAVSWVKANPKEAASVGAEYLSVPARAVELALPHSRLAATAAKDISRDIMVFFEELHRLNPKIVGGKLPDASLFASL